MRNGISVTKIFHPHSALHWEEHLSVVNVSIHKHWRQPLLLSLKTQRQLWLPSTSASCYCPCSHYFWLGTNWVFSASPAFGANLPTSSQQIRWKWAWYTQLQDNLCTGLAIAGLYSCKARRHMETQLQLGISKCTKCWYERQVSNLVMPTVALGLHYNSRAYIEFSLVSPTTKWKLWSSTKSC